MAVGQGEVKKRKDRPGWEIRYYDADNRRRRSPTYPTKRAADQAWEKLRREISDGTFVPAKEQTTLIGDFMEAWFARQVGLKEKTLAGYRSLIESRVRPRWGDVTFGRLTRGGMLEWLAELAGSVSASRTRQAYYLFSSIVDEAVLEGLVGKNPAPAREVDLPKLVAKEHIYLTHEQLWALADGSGPYKSLVLVLGYCGIRYGESIALRVVDVDVERARLHVQWSTTDVNGRMVTDTPKTHQRRWVPVPAEVMEFVAAEIAGREPEELVWRSPRGAVLRENNWRRNFFDRAAAEHCPAGFTPHQLRHTAASLAIAAGASVKGVQRMLGHETATMTLDHYGHLFPDELDAVATRLSEQRALELAQAAVKRAQERQQTEAAAPNVVSLASRRRASG